MVLRNEYRVLRDVTLSSTGLEEKPDDAIIIEHTDDGIVYLWPLFPRHLEDNDSLTEHQDLEDYLVDGAWLVSEPWMYFDRIDDVISLLNRQQRPLEQFDLGRLISIREARAKAMVFLSLT